ncbi:hypothetical protein [Helicobacter cetorum]|uniref:Uncharacterized protein n=1 Tax=Helicobacter cetorum (strain ATCC BAA-429 / MIT 00-7128) TaxID=182217 RepID=I0EMS7_HELC0|nr:hypothetical protein [Helicobacter cetorum]AFI04246.1 hypothetical protein HCW_04895 [Helicobacter cetorum MIT 00-7128]
MQNILNWHLYKLNKKLDKFELEGSLCFGNNKLVENCYSIKKPSNIGLQEKNIQKDIETSRWLTEIQRERNLIIERKQKEEQSKRFQKAYQAFLENCKPNGIKRFDYDEGYGKFLAECNDNHTEQPLEKPLNNNLNSQNTNKKPQNNIKMFDYFNNPMLRY